MNVQTQFTRNVIAENVALRQVPKGGVRLKWQDVSSSQRYSAHRGRRLDKRWASCVTKLGLLKTCIHIVGALHTLYSPLLHRWWGGKEVRSLLEDTLVA